MAGKKAVKGQTVATSGRQTSTSVSSKKSAKSPRSPSLVRSNSDKKLNKTTAKGAGATGGLKKSRSSASLGTGARRRALTGESSGGEEDDFVVVSPSSAKSPKNKKQQQAVTAPVAKPKSSNAGLGKRVKPAAGQAKPKAKRPAPVARKRVESESSTSSSDSSSSDSSSSSSSSGSSSSYSSDSDYDSDSSYSSSDDSSFDGRKKRRRRRNRSQLLRSLNRFLPPILALPLFLILKVFVVFPYQVVWAGAKRGARIVMYAQPYAEKAYHVVKTRVPWEKLKQLSIAGAKQGVVYSKIGWAYCKDGTIILWAASKIWGERGVVLTKAFGAKASIVGGKVGVVLYDLLVKVAIAAKDGLISFFSGVKNMVITIVHLPVTIGRGLLFLPWNILQVLRDFSRFFKENQENLADIVATIIGMYILGVIFGVLFGPIVVKLGWMKYETLDALGVAELCVSLGLLKRPGWFVW